MSKPTLTYNCPKSFDKMTKIEGSTNRFCRGCEKEIVNFTTMSDEEIKSFFKKEKKVCGYFYKNQLENTKVSFVENVLLTAKRKLERHSTFLKVPLLALIGGLLFLSACSSSTTGKVEKSIPYPDKVGGFVVDTNSVKIEQQDKTIKNE